MATLSNEQAVVTGIYTLMPTHCGTGQTRGAVDLPIARESHTGCPFLPATSLKGVARDSLGNRVDEQTLKRLFGPKDAGQEKSKGALIFSEGRLIAMPVRSLNRPFLYVTAPLILNRLERDFRALELPSLLAEGRKLPHPKEKQLLVADKALESRTVVLEDLVYSKEEVARLPQVQELATALTELLPEEEADTRSFLSSNLVVIPDEDFADLVDRAVPVQARTALTEGKTTGPYKSMSGEEQTGNLWYEEVMPADSLFASFVVMRKGASGGTSSGEKANGEESSLGTFRRHASQLETTQIGGNETVGQGWCWWKIP